MNLFFQPPAENQQYGWSPVLMNDPELVIIYY